MLNIKNTAERGKKLKNTTIVTYHNFMNQIIFKGFQKRDYDFFMVLCSQLRDQKTNKIILTFREIKELSHYNLSTNNERFISELRRMYDRLMSISSRIEIENRISMFVLFHTFDIDKDKQTLTVSVNENFLFLLNNLNREFTELDLKNFTSLKSRYSKALYRKLRQFRFTGIYIVKIDELKQFLDVPKDYTPNKLKDKAINPAIRELKEYFPGLHVETNNAKTRGNKILGFTFKFKKQSLKISTDNIVKEADFETGDVDAVLEKNVIVDDPKEITNDYDEMCDYLLKICRTKEKL